MGSSMMKKQGKFRFFDWTINEGGTSRPSYSGALDPKTLEYRRIGPDLAATLFLSPHQWQKFFLNRVSTPPIYRGRWGENVFRCITVRWVFCAIVWPLLRGKIPRYFDTNLEKIKKSLVILMKNFFLTPSKIICRV